MTLKSKQPPAAPSRDGTYASRSSVSDRHSAGFVLATKKLLRQRRVSSVETIEARLVRKAKIADTKAFANESLGQMTREKRHKLLYGD